MTIAVILLFIVLLGLIAFKLAVTDVNAGVFTAKPSGELPGELAKAVILDSEYRVNEGQLNSFAAYLIGSGSKSESKNLSVTDVYINFKQDGSNRCYMRLANESFTFDFAADCAITLENGEIDLVFTNASVGKLPLPDALLCYILDGTDLGAFNKYVYTGASSPELHFPTHYGLEIQDWGELVTVDITSLTITDDNVVIKTNPVLEDSLQNAAGMLKDKLGDIAGGLISEYSDYDYSGLSSYFN